MNRQQHSGAGGVHRPGQVIWLLGLCMGASLMVGAYFGARTAIGGGAKFIRPVFILVVLALTARLAWQHWFSEP